MQSARYQHRGGSRYVLRPGGWVRLMAAGLLVSVLLVLAVYRLLPAGLLVAAALPSPSAARTMKAQASPVTVVVAASQVPSSGTVLTPEQIDQAGPLVLVNAASRWPQGYEPKLITMAEHRPYGLVGLKSTEMRADPEAFAALVRLLEAAKKDGVTGIAIVSSYRGYEKQKKLFDDRVQELMKEGLNREAAEAKTADTVARPGCSEHQTGLAFDLVVMNGDGTLQSFGQTAQCDWMQHHCQEYGFVQRYPAGKENVTGIDNEPWHYRFVGMENAQAITEDGLCLEEYVAQRADDGR